MKYGPAISMTRILPTPLVALLNSASSLVMYEEVIQ